MTVSSPCIAVCVIDPVSGLCRGCGRTLHEIADWAVMSENTRRQLMAELAARMEKSPHA